MATGPYGVLALSKEFLHDAILAPPCLLPDLALTRDDQGLRIALGDAQLAGETACPLSHQHDVFAALQYATGQSDGIGERLETNHRASLQRTAVHDGRVQFHHAIAVEDGADASIKGRIVLHDAGDRFHSIQR